MKQTVFVTHLLQHLYIGAAPLFLFIMRDLSVNYSELGLIISTRTFFAGFCQLFFGFLQKKASRKAILNLSNALSVFSTIGMGISETFSHFLFFNALWGLSTSLVHPLGACVIEDSSDTKKKSMDTGMFYSYAYIGNVIGAIFATVLILYIGWREIFFLIALLTSSVLVFGYFFLFEKINGQRVRPLFFKVKSFNNKKVILICIVGILFFGGTNTFIRHLVPLFLTNQLNLSAKYSSLFYILILIIGIFSPIFFAWISKKWDKKFILIFIASLSAALFYLTAGHTKITHSLIFILSFEAFLAWPLLALLQSFLAERLQSLELKGMAVDLLLTVNICSFIIWASVFGYLIDLSKSFDLVFHLISLFCLISIPLMLIIDK